MDLGVFKRTLRSFWLISRREHICEGFSSDYRFTGDSKSTYLIGRLIIEFFWIS